MRRARYRPCIILSFTLWVLCALTARAETLRGEPQSIERQAVAGGIWDAGAARFVTEEAFFGRLERAHFVLLGEVHGNPRHHRLQRRIIEHLVARGRRPAIVFEMFERNAQPLIDRLREQHPDDADRIVSETKMTERGWSARLYRPLIDTVLARDLPLIGADLSQSTVNEIVTDGLGALSAERRATLGLDPPLSKRNIETLRADIIVAHCGHAPLRIIGGMVDAQRARDAALARGLIEHGKRDGAVLIAGAGHVRGDLAAPVYLRRRAPDKDFVTVALTEIDGARKPESYAPSEPGARPIYDYLWFTRGYDESDPCERFEDNAPNLESSASKEPLSQRFPRHGDAKHASHGHTGSMPWTFWCSREAPPESAAIFDGCKPKESEAKQKSHFLLCVR